MTCQLLAVVGDLRGPGLLALADEGVRRRRCRRGAIRSQAYSSIADPGPRDRLLAGDEVPGEVDAELLGGLDAVLLGEGVHRVLGGVGRQDVGVGAGVVDLLHVAGQRDGDVQVLDVVGVAVARDPDDAVLRLAVLVLAEIGGHAV